MTSAEKNYSRANWLLAAVMTLAVLVLHFYFLFHAGGLWRDEVNTVNLAGRNSWHAMSEDSFPALMPLALHAWIGIGFGSSDFSMRFFGMLVGLAIPVAFWMASWKLRRSPPLIALALFGLNSIVITYTDSIRAYGLGSLCLALAVTAACFFLNRPSWKRAGIFSFTAILSVQALYQNAVFIAAICAGICVISIRRKTFAIAIKAFFAGLLAAASLLPYWKIVASLPDAAAALRVGVDLRSAYTDLDTAAGFPMEQYLHVWEFLALVVVIYSLIKFFNGQTKDFPPADNFLFAGSTLIFAIVLFSLFLLLAKLPTQPWYFLPLLALTATCLEIGLPPMPRLLRAPWFGFILATAIIAVPLAIRDLNWRFTDADLLAQRLQKESSRDDYVVVTPWIFGISFDRYFKGSAPWDTLPPLQDHSMHRYDLVREQMQKTNAIGPVLKQIARTLQSNHRVWVVGNADETRKPGEPIPRDLPPPPLKNSDWSDMPYRATWSQQVDQFIADHSRRFEKVLNSKTNRAINYYENMNLYLATGWKDSSTIKSNEP